MITCFIDLNLKFRDKFIKLFSCFFVLVLCFGCFNFNSRASENDFLSNYTILYNISCSFYSESQDYINISLSSFVIDDITFYYYFYNSNDSKYYEVHSLNYVYDFNDDTPYMNAILINDLFTQIFSCNYNDGDNKYLDGNYFNSNIFIVISSSDLKKSFDTDKVVDKFTSDISFSFTNFKLFYNLVSSINNNIYITQAYTSDLFDYYFMYRLKSGTYVFTSLNSYVSSGSPWNIRLNQFFSDNGWAEGTFPGVSFEFNGNSVLYSVFFTTATFEGTITTYNINECPISIDISSKVSNAYIEVGYSSIRNINTTSNDPFVLNNIYTSYHYTQGTNTSLLFNSGNFNYNTFVYSADVFSLYSLDNISISSYYSNAFQNGYNKATADLKNTIDNYNNIITEKDALIDSLNKQLSDSLQGKYTFSQLFFGVAQVPVQIIGGMLNFDLLGINLFAVFSGIFTALLLIWLIKKFI